MLTPRRKQTLGVLVVAACALLPLAARAQAPAASDIDDPKVFRRLKTREALPAPAAATTSPAAPTAGSTAAAPVSPTPSPVVVPAPVQPLVAAPTVVAPLESGTASAGEDAITRKVAPAGESDGSSETFGPRLKLGFRRFSFVRIGATDAASTTGTAASEPFDVLSLDFYPVSSFVRFGLSAQYGAESGKLGGGGDFFLAQSFSLGAQIPGHIFTPFAEAFAGGGYLRRMQFATSVPTGYWQYGVDVGTEIFMAKYACLSVALGYIHPVNGFTKGLSFTSVYVDTWSLKLGFGI